MNQHHIILVSLFVVIANVGCAEARKYNTSPPPLRDDKIRVHMVPHSHDDVGWNKNILQYYTGMNDSIQIAAVKYTISTVVEQLQQNKDRTFTEVEQAFFQRWWNENQDLHDEVLKLYQTGQLEFANGGWSMHDEANPYYQEMIDQTTLGHEFLLREFNAKPRIGWQIDPFGHSSTQAALLSAEVGFDALYFARIDYQDLELRTNESRLQMVWRASPSLGPDAQVFTGVFHHHYGPPPGLCFDILCYGDGQVQDDPALEGYNVDEYVDLFVKTAQEWASHQPDGQNQVLFLMGSDFQYRNAIEWYANLDKLMHYVNQDGRVHALYSTPAMYTDAVHAQNLTWTVKTDDFFPYADVPHGYWTGYFTSRPTQKGITRVTSAFARGTSLAFGLIGGDEAPLQVIRDAVGVSQHHDAVTGTAKQHVVFDYYKRFSEGVTNASWAFHTALAAKMTQDPARSGPAVQSVAESMVGCLRLNESVCAASTGGLGDSFDVVVYNWLPRTRTELIRIPLSDEVDPAQVTVRNASMQTVRSQVIQNEPVPFVSDGSAQSVVFLATMPATGFSVYTISSPRKRNAIRGRLSVDSDPAAPTGMATRTVTNGIMEVTIDTTTGRIVQIANRQSNLSMTVQQEWFWYNSSAGTNSASWGNNGTQNSGAYIFRPNQSDPTIIGGKSVAYEIRSGPLVTEIEQRFASWLNQTVRLVQGQDFVEVESTVGAIPDQDGLGKEIITRWSIDVQNGDTWFTDSNGREFLERRYNHRPTWKLNVTEPVAGNYYPTTAAVRLEDTHKSFSILVDRAQGSASLANGEVEVMVHRRLQWDDARGVNEALNETSGVQYHPEFRRLGHGLVVRSTHRLRLDKPAEAARGYRPLMDRIYAYPMLAFKPTATEDADQPMLERQGTFVRKGLELPINVHLSNADPWSGDGILVRVSHQFARGEDHEYSRNATVDLSSLFDESIASIVELTLTGNRRLADLHRLQWNTEDGVMQQPRSVLEPLEVHAPVGQRGIPQGSAVITLTPMKIRTFQVTFAK